MRYIAESTTLGTIIGDDHITTFFEASILPISWEAVEKGVFEYLSIGSKVKFFYHGIFRQRVSIFLSHALLLAH